MQDSIGDSSLVFYGHWANVSREVVLEMEVEGKPYLVAYAVVQVSMVSQTWRR